MTHTCNTHVITDREENDWITDGTEDRMKIDGCARMTDSMGIWYPKMDTFPVGTSQNQTEYQ